MAEEYKPLLDAADITLRVSDAPQYTTISGDSLMRSVVAHQLVTHISALYESERKHLLARIAQMEGFAELNQNIIQGLHIDLAIERARSAKLDDIIERVARSAKVLDRLAAKIGADEVDHA